MTGTLEDTVNIFGVELALPKKFKLLLTDQEGQGSRTETGRRNNDQAGSLDPRRSEEGEGGLKRLRRLWNVHECNRHEVRHCKRHTPE